LRGDNRNPLGRCYYVFCSARRHQLTNGDAGTFGTETTGQESQSEPQRLKYAVLAMTIVPGLFRRWFERPGFVRYVKHAYWIGGHDVVGRGGIDLDEYGLEWVRTLTLRYRKTNIEMRRQVGDRRNQRNRGGEVVPVLALL
jgi:hypothetical protein